MTFSELNPYISEIKKIIVMKNYIFLLAPIFMFCIQSCNSQNPPMQISDQKAQSSDYQLHYLEKDMFYLALPDGWNVVGPRHTGNPYIIGPQGIKVYSNTIENYYYNCNPMMVQAAQAKGWQIVNPVALETIVEQNLKSRIEAQGGKFIKKYSLTNLENADRYLAQITIQAHGFQPLGVNVLATEWMNPEGNRSLIVLTQTMIRSHTGFSMWSLSMEELEAPEAVFENAKEIYLEALTNKKYDEQQIIAAGRNQRAQHQQQMASNQAMWNQRMRNSAIAHQNRMAANQASFQATQKAFTDASNSISDMSMNGYWSRSASSYQSQQNAVNGIHEEQTITNPYNGNSMQVNQGYKRTFVDPYGNYYQTNDVLMNQGEYSQLDNYREVK